MSWPFEWPEGIEAAGSIRGTLESVQGCRPFIETYTSELLPWITTSATHNFAKPPPQERFPALLTDSSSPLRLTFPD
jgi:hypothetical protein